MAAEILWGRNRNLSPASKHTLAALPDLVAYFRFTHAAGVSLPVPLEISNSRPGHESIFSKTLLYEK